MADVAPIINPISPFRSRGCQGLGRAHFAIGFAGVRSRFRLQRTPYAEQIAADWELPRPDMLI